MLDRFSEHSPGLDAPASHGFSITPNDGTDLGETTRAIYVGTSGNLTAVLASGAELVFTSIMGGTILPLRIRRIKATGTTAAGLVGLL